MSPSHNPDPNPSHNPDPNPSPSPAPSPGADHAQDRWTEVDDYFGDLLAPADPALTATLRDSESSGLPPINVAPTQGKLLHLLARIQGAHRVLEIGTLGGYSTIWLARALPAEGGHLLTLEYSEEHAAVAAANLSRAGLDKITEIRTGPALDSLAALHAEAPAPFDLVFIDADKANNRNYLEWSLKLTRPGSLIIVDNVVRGGGVVDADSDDPAVRGTRAALELIASHPKLDGTAVQTVGLKGHDGFALARVLD
ncbi:O-methyltransferase [Streptomyces aureocirculatus]|uniref:O-methyltransferase n=1 Tax=Streptomyces aureocirculatus TaxID=67275 RepID=UPI00099E07B4|nr:O-methyltransferase [Streptomyces aureocirculatus]